MILTRRALLSASLLTVLVGCATTPEQAPPPIPAPQRRTPPVVPEAPESGQPPQAQKQQQQELAVEALIIMTTWHTETDTTQTAADLRARAYFTQELAATIVAPERNGASGEFFAHPCSTSIPQVIAVEGTDSNHPGLLSFEVSWEWVDAAGNSTPGESVRLYSLAMTNTPEGWKISDYTYEEYPRRSQ